MWTIPLHHHEANNPLAKIIPLADIDNPLVSGPQEYQTVGVVGFIGEHERVVYVFGNGKRVTEVVN